MRGGLIVFLGGSVWTCSWVFLQSPQAHTPLEGCDVIFRDKRNLVYLCVTMKGSKSDWDLAANWCWG